MVAISPRVRRETRAVLELFVVCGFAITQPLLSLFGSNPDVLIYRGARPRDVVLFALIVTLFPTVGVWCIELVLGLVSARARQILHYTVLLLFTALFAVQLMKHFFTGAVIVVVTAALFVGACGALYAKT